MRRRLLEGLGVAVVFLAVATLLRLTTLPAVGQEAPAGTAPGAAAEAGPAPVTPWGAPDLQGIWTEVYQTPLQRPAQYGDRELLTAEEQAVADQRRVAAPNLDSRLAPRGSEQDVGSAYSAVFQSFKPTSRRTSLIVDPPDGRIPPVTAEVGERDQVLRAFGFALLQATEICENELPPCAGWTYGPPSPRRDEVPPYYIIRNPTGGGGGGGHHQSRRRSRRPRQLGALSGSPLAHVRWVPSDRAVSRFGGSLVRLVPRARLAPRDSGD